MGVKLAVKRVDELSKQSENKPLQIFGDLIHNQHVIDELKERGIETFYNRDDAKQGTIIIRAHGTTPDNIEYFQSQGYVVENATCPRVIVSQGKIHQFSNDGYTIIIAGHKNHGEVLSLKGFAKKSIVVETLEEAKQLNVPEKSMLICQTTYSAELFAQISEILKSKNSAIVINNTICHATQQRQDALKEIIPQVEAILVVGGKKSSNTQRLYETARKGCPAWHIQDIETIPQEIFQYKTVGITSGASTPDYLVDEIISYLEEHGS